MTTFDDREKGFEKKFALDQEQLFRAQARRNKLFGQWAAGKMGLSGAEADAYAKSVVLEDMKEPGDDDVLRKVEADLAAKGVKAAKADLSKELDKAFVTAKEQIVKESKKA